MRTMAKASMHTALNLLFFTLIGTSVLAMTYDLTHETIAKTVEEEKLKLITQIVPNSMFDNDVVKDTVSVAPDPLLGTDNPITAYRARLQGRPSAVVLESIAPDGYSGKIFLLVAIRDNGDLAGVRVVAHRETPGLGDYIEIGKGNWIKGFDGKSLTQYKDSDWKVRKDGGKFDYMAGATITPRAVVKAVYKTLKYYDQHREALFAQAAPVTAPAAKEKQ